MDVAAQAMKDDIFKEELLDTEIVKEDIDNFEKAYELFEKRVSVIRAMFS